MRFTKEWFLQAIGTISFKIILLSLMIITLLGLLSIPLSRFNSSDPLPNLQPVSAEWAKEYEAFAAHVDTGLFIRNFSQFGMTENKFIIDMVVWFLFNPAEITLETISLFSFENGKISEKSPPDVKIIGDKTFVKYNIIAEIKTNLEFKKFPLDDHRLSLVLTNNFVTPAEVMFLVASTDFMVAPKIFVSDWVIKNLRTNFGFDENILNQIDKTKTLAYPKASFTIDFAKAGIRKVFIIFVPIFLIFFFSLLAFLLTVENIVGRSTLTTTAVTGLLGYRFVIENMMPNVGYFTFTDYVYITLLLFSFVSFVFHMVTTTIYNLTEKDNQQVAIAVVMRLSHVQNVVFIILSCLITVVLGVIILI